MKIKLMDIIELLSARHPYSVMIDGVHCSVYYKKDELTYGMLQMNVVGIGTSLHQGIEHLVLQLEREKGE